MGHGSPGGAPPLLAEVAATAVGGVTHRVTRARLRTGRFPVLFCWLVLSGIAAPAQAQFTVRSWMRWRSIETPHFSLHYPAELEEWTTHLASRIEAIHAAVVHDVGYTPPRRTQIVVDDPYELANGSAWPYVNGAVINVWATPPTPRQDIGEFRDWGPTLVAHEFAHVAHLARPSRNPLVRRFWDALPVNLGPVALKAPRWIVEGYATYIEGLVSGSGRPHGAWRSAFLREWAVEGQLPRYEQLDNWNAYEGGEFAYLAGSEFLEWLVRRPGQTDSSLVHLWRRLSARQDRSFDDAFSGVFGESARVLYGYFSADLTANAVATRARIRAAWVGADSGRIVQRLSWDTGDPAFSPDGQRIALVLRSPTMRSRVVIWRATPEPDTARARRDSVLLHSDPEDVAAQSPFPPARKPLATLRSTGASYQDPRFLRDGRVLLWRSAPVGDGTARPDLYLWNPRVGAVRRVTRGASVREADPTPDGRSAIAVQCRRGWCDLVTVDLERGSVQKIVEGGARRTFYHPRMKPDGTQAVVSVHDGERWRLALVDTRSHALRYLAMRDSANHYDAAWASNTEFVDVSDNGGVPNVESVILATLETRPLSSVVGAAVAPAPNPRDGSVWFLSLYARGYDLRATGPRSGSGASTTVMNDLTELAMSPAPESHAASVPAPVPPSRPFGLGARLQRWVPIPLADADGAAAALSFTSTDVVGRSEVVTTAAYGDAAAWRGGRVQLSWRGTRPSVGADFFSAEHRPSASRSRVPGSASLDERLTGAALGVGGGAQYDTWGLRYRTGAAAMSRGRRLLYGDVGASWTQRGDITTRTELLSAVLVAGRAEGQTFHRAMGAVGVSGMAPAGVPLGLSALFGRTTASAPQLERFALGGGPSPLLDHDLIAQRISMPALPAGVSIGSSVVAYRATLNTRPLALYWWAGSTAEGSRFATWNRVIGLEWSQAVPAIAAAGTPSARGQLGIGESLDAPFQRRIRAYVSLILNP